MNIGAGFEISIKDMMSLVTEYTGFEGKIIWNTTKPDGQRRRCLDITKTKIEFGFEAKVSLKEALRRTINWYKKTMQLRETIKSG